MADGSPTSVPEHAGNAATPVGLEELSVDYGVRPRAAAPNAITELADLSLQVRATDAWRAATRLNTVLEAYAAFLGAAYWGHSISATDQAAVDAVVDGLGDIQTVLRRRVGPPEPSRRIVGVRSDGTEVDLMGSVFDLGDCFSEERGQLVRLLGAFPVLIRQSARALVALGVGEPTFSRIPTNPIWERFVDPFSSGPDRDGHVCVNELVLRPVPHPQLQKLHEGVGRLLDLLAVAPSAAFVTAAEHRLSPVPGHSGGEPTGPCRRDRFRVDRQLNVVSIDDKSFRVTPAAAAWLDLLRQANGRWESFGDLKERDPALEGKKADRLWNGLPPEIQDVVESQPGAGYRLRFELWK